MRRAGCARRARRRRWFTEPARRRLTVAVNPKEVVRILHSKTGHNTIFNLAVKDGENTPVMIVDWQRDPVKDTLLHVDMKRIDLTHAAGA